MHDQGIGSVVEDLERISLHQWQWVDPSVIAKCPHFLPPSCRTKKRRGRCSSCRGNSGVALPGVVRLLPLRWGNLGGKEWFAGRLSDVLLGCRTRVPFLLSM